VLNRKAKLMNNRKTLLLAALLGAPLLANGVARAETLVVDDQVVVRESTIERPAKGATMAKVEARFGAPQTRHPTVGKPPITRWDYAGFSVFFEGDRVIHAVALAN
jgi:hypothetical protein